MFLRTHFGESFCRVEVFCHYGEGFLASMLRCSKSLKRFFSQTLRLQCGIRHNLSPRGCCLLIVTFPPIALGLGFQLVSQCLLSNRLWVRMLDMPPFAHETADSLGPHILLDKNRRAEILSWWCFRGRRADAR